MFLSRFKLSENERYKIEKVLFSFSKWLFFLIFIFLPLITNIIFNAVYHFPLSNEDTQARLIFTIVIGCVQTTTFLYFIFRFPKYFIFSGAIFLALFELLVFFSIPLFFGAIFDNIFRHDSSAANESLVIVQIVFYVILTWFYFKFCKGNAGFMRRFFSTNKSASNWTYAFNSYMFSNQKPTFDYWKLIIFTLWGAGIAYLAGSVNINSFTHLFFNQSDNQDGINEILRSTLGKVIIFLLSVLAAPVVEELATRQNLILPMLYKNDDVNDMRNFSYFNKGKDFTIKNIVYLTIISMISVYFFAQIHSYFFDLRQVRHFILTSLIFTGVFLLGNFNFACSAGAHGVYNLIVYIIIVAEGRYR